MSFDAARLANAATAALRAYDPGHDLPTLRARFGAELAELGSNENPSGPSPLVLHAIKAALPDLARYPDPRGAALKSVLARHLGVEPGRITLGNGSHELLMLLAQCFADPEHSVVHSQYGFAVFPIATAAAAAQAIRVPAFAPDHARAPYGHDLDAMAGAIRPDTRLVYAANPNNPTGTWFGDAELETFLARVPQHVLVVIDEAYREYVTAPGVGSALALAARYPNLVVTRTFSKAYGLAGLRIGYMVSDPSVAAVVERLRESFNVNSLALVAAQAALEDQAHIADVRRDNAAERDWLAGELRARGHRVLPSQTNFVLVDLPVDAGALEQRLFERGVIVRPMAGYGLPHTLRVSIGTRADNHRLLDALPYARPRYGGDRLNAASDWISTPVANPLRGELAIPGDKSISHRAILLAALADGVSRIDGFLDAGDTRATVAMFARMGVCIEAPAPEVRIVHGVGIDGLTAADGVLDCGNSGTAMRLAAGVLAGQGFDSVLVGDASLSRRPMRRVIEPLRTMGAQIAAGQGDVAPLRIRGGLTLRGIDCTTSVASAQVKSAILLAGLYAEGETRVREPRPTRDHTERMLAAFGWPIACDDDSARLSGGQRLHATDVLVPGDFSSAAFFMVAATLVPGSDLLLRGVGLNPRRCGLVGALRRMGADIRIEHSRECGGEVSADLRVHHAPLHGIEIAPGEVADMIDEFPILFVAAAAARGRCVIRGAAELRVKESDRIAVMAAGLRALGVDVTETADGAVIEGGELAGGRVASAGDHRCAMSFAVAGLIAHGPIAIGDCANVATSFPGFLDLANACGFRIAAQDGIGIGSAAAKATP